MSNSLYSEAIEAAEQIKLSAEDKVKQQLIESLSPQIKLMVEKKLFESEGDESEEEVDEECGMESLDESEEEVDESYCSESDDDASDDENKVELNAESRRILNTLITNNAKRNAIKQKISELSEGFSAIQNAIVLAESSSAGVKSQQKIASLYKKLVSEVSKLKNNNIIKTDNELLREFYKLNKELRRMSTRRKNRRYLNENLDSLLEMNLFEADDEEEPEAEEPMDDAEDAKEDMDMDMPDLEDEPQDMSDKSADELADELERIAGDVRGLGGEAEPEPEEDEEELDLEGIFESDEMHQEELDEMDDMDEPDDLEEMNSSTNESRRRRSDVILEIDENMLKREISKMKTLREGEAKQMASHFGGGSAGPEAFVDGVELNKLHEMKMAAAKVIRKNRMLERKLQTHKKALRKMKSQLSEMNLFNAKLLYANKLMQNRDLTMRQQKSIVESLDSAKTLSEAKILFESLTKSLTSKPTSSNKRLSEGALRRRPTSASSSAPVRSAQTLNESVALDRWATLAGIKR